MEYYTPPEAEATKWGCVFIFLLCLALVIGGNELAKKDQAQPETEPQPYHSTPTTLYFPLLNVPGPSPKKALAGFGLDVADQLCLTDNFNWHQWGTSLQYLYDSRIPFVWDYKGISSFVYDVYRPWYGTVFFANEPDLEGQANMTPEQSAALAYSIKVVCQSCRLAGPNLSQLTPLSYMSDFFDAYLELGGTDKDFAATTTHIYADSAEDFTAMLNRFADSLPQPLADKPILITELNGTDGTYDTAYAVFSAAEKDPRVAQYYAFIPKAGTQTVFNHLALFDNNNNITPVGRAFRDVGCNNQ